MKIIIIGSSTGGPFILEQILSGLSSLPPSFTDAFRKHICEQVRMPVEVGEKDQILRDHRIIIGPPGHHLLLDQNRRIILDDRPKLHGVKPAVDLTMLSMKRRHDDHLMGVILTGMGQDGTAGIVHMHEIGGLTIAQLPETSPIKSMPQSAIDTGKVDKILNPADIREAIITFSRF